MYNDTLAIMRNEQLKKKDEWINKTIIVLDSQRLRPIISMCGLISFRLSGNLWDVPSRGDFGDNLRCSIPHIANVKKGMFMI